MDIVERLRKDISPLRDLKSTERNKLHRDAADEIARLREQCDRMASLATDLAIGLDDASKKCGKLENEIERLRDALRWAAPYVKDDPRVSAIIKAALKENK